MSLDMLTIKDKLNKVAQRPNNVSALCTRMLVYMKDASEADCRGIVEKATQFK